MRFGWLLGSFLLFSAAAFAQSEVPVIRFDSVAEPLKLPDNLYFGEVTGVAVNSKGHLFVLSRGNSTGPAYAAAAAQLLEFDQNGKYVREIGHNLYAWSFGHSVRVDPHDNIFASAAYLRFLRGKYGYPTMFAAYNDGPGNLEDRLRDGGLLPEETRLYLVNVTASVEGRKGAARGMAQFTRPNGAPILIDCAQVVKVRAPLPDEYAPSVLAVVTIGKVRQGVREDLKSATAIIRAHGGAI